MRAPIIRIVLLSFALGGGGCVGLRGSEGGGQTRFDAPRRVDAGDVALPGGYRIEAVATGLNLPTGVAFDAQNRPVVVEGGYAYGELFQTPRLIRIERDGNQTVIASGEEGVPWTGAVFRDGAFYVVEGGELTGGRVVRMNADGGDRKVLVADLPSRGDHHTNGPAIDREGNVYFGVGTATNSGVVGMDNYKFGWLRRFPEFHDVPARDVKLAGKNFTTKNPLTPDEDDEATTGAYVPFGTRTEAGQVIRGRLPANGAVMRVPAGGGEPQLVAWGLRNPFGLAFAPDGSLYVTENQFDVRGSRPVWGTGDLLWRIDPKREPVWHGWPDFHGHHPLTWSGHFKPPGKDAPEFVLAEHPNEPPEPAAKLPVHAAAGGLDFSRSQSFGHEGEAFIALFGDMAPNVGDVLEPVGYRVVRVDPESGAIEAFAVNRGEENGPASKLNSGGLERPVAARFDNTGEALYVVDFGVMTMDERGAHPRANTGVLWRITREEAR